ncbi:uncharacterized protein LOC113217694 [Frankliniella occidentalis]|uniref:MICOS complex subunit MIC13 n=1 Tax=Frankliniella occidentalis TaxID=133901 RepID=A0A6J1TJL2_FRAOC|nr:uncharacterized protein LOC113217694 [Frankliniella occidentalis]
MLCTCSAHALHMLCTCSAHALHMLRKCSASPSLPLPPAQPVRVCGPRDVQRLRPPPSCPCPLEEPPLTAAGRLLHMLGLTLKAAFVFGLVAFSNEQGLWAGHEGTARLYGRAALCLANSIDVDLKLPPGQLPEVPVTHELARRLGSLWNRGVALVFDGIMLVPTVLDQTIREPPATQNPPPEQTAPPPHAYKK